MKAERDIEKELTQKVRELGGLSYKWVSPGSDGVPDRIIIMPGGTVWFVELKTEKGRLSQIQRYQIKRLRKAGCLVRTIYGQKGLEGFLNEIQSA